MGIRDAAIDAREKIGGDMAMFDDDESVEVRTSDVLSEDANARVRVLTADVEDAMDVKMSAANAGKTKMGAATMFARLFGTDGERGSKRDRAASPAVKMNRRKAADGTRTQDLGRLARELAQQLDEPKVRLLARAINELGEAQVRAYVLEAATQQRHGGEMTALGDRRRTTGGIFWAIVRARTKPEVYDIIYAEERERLTSSTSVSRRGGRCQTSSRVYFTSLTRVHRWCDRRGITTRSTQCLITSRFTLSGKK